ncbi:hypothetical protein T03_16821 [Trichinella britovi]|uniref:Uncharacterized protein n=1 Tax=Trichinella britovi TaxID=45882 RepID=A0A0V0ZFG0_TRIBR|nr:hypothetical protein T03_16821 [Trichinella britovi]
MEKKEDKWRKSRSVKGTLEKIDTIWRCQVWKASSLQKNTKTQYTDVTKDQYCVIS